MGLSMAAVCRGHVRVEQLGGMTESPAQNLVRERARVRDSGSVMG
jgi:hypothetical protein